MASRTTGSKETRNSTPDVECNPGSTNLGSVHTANRAFGERYGPFAKVMGQLNGDSPATPSLAPRSLDQAKPLYLLPSDNFAEEVLIPAFRAASAADCMVGFFSSAVLADLAPGLATYVRNAPASLRLIVSPFLSEADQRALEAGLKNPEEVAGDLLTDGIVGEDDLQRHTLTCLSYLLAVHRIELKIALLRGALFHPKVWIFETESGHVAAHGSSNMTIPGIRRNKEQITFSRSWLDPTQDYIVAKLRDEFDRLWNNQDPDCLVFPLPEAVKQRILRNYPVDIPPSEEDFLELFWRARAVWNNLVESDEAAEISYEKPIFTIPSWLSYQDGSYAHQGEAVNRWIEAEYRGTLAMATGSGKTLTALIGAYRLSEQQRPLLIVVAVPYVPLIQQWCDEIAQFGLSPLNLTTVGGASDRSQLLKQVRRRLRLGVSQIEVVVVSHETLCTPEFDAEIRSFDSARLLIADEAHNLGRPSFVANPPSYFEYRLALSATPIRQYDPDGTDAIFSFFGPVVYEFTLQQAIGTCLVEYDYFVHPVPLSAMEMDSWSELTERIRQNAWRRSGGQIDDYLAKLFRDRRLILETAERKLAVLEELLGREDLRALKHTLIYASDKTPIQLDAVNRFLKSRGVLFHQLTAEETTDRRKTVRILQSFQRGDIQVLTAKRVLDEGVNIPQITKSFILASTTLERQWIQRRGRLLRRSPEIGKTHSTIHDLLALPPTLDGQLDEDTRSLIKSELRRAQEFSSLARNAGQAGGPLEVIHSLVQAALM